MGCDRHLLSGWLYRRLPGILVILGGLLVLVLFHPADMGLKIGAASVIAAIVVAGSFVGVDVTPRPQTRRQMFSDAESRRTSALPAVASLDLNRPILAIAVTGEGDATIYLVLLEDAGKGRVIVVPATVRGRPPEGLEYESVAEARRALQRLGAGVLPQSDFSDKVATSVFGADWQELN
jgi:hypothetical protein